jgi:hypothetical protein
VTHLRVVHDHVMLTEITPPQKSTTIRRHYVDFNVHHTQTDCDVTVTHADFAGVKPLDGSVAVVTTPEGNDFRNDRADIAHVDSCPSETADGARVVKMEHCKRRSRTVALAEYDDRFSEPPGGCFAAGVARMTFGDIDHGKCAKSDVFDTSSRRLRDGDEDDVVLAEEDVACAAANAATEKTIDDVADVNELPAAECMEPRLNVTDIYVDQPGYIITEDDLDSVVVVEISD